MLEGLEALKNAEYETYVTFYKDFGVMLKDGVGRDRANRDRLADLLLFQSTKTKPDEFTTLADYAWRMPADQKEIYFLVGEVARAGRTLAAASNRSGPRAGRCCC